MAKTRRLGSPLRLLLLGGAVLALGGCHSTYDQINFCWDSNFHVPPHERMVLVPQPTQAVAQAIERWAQSQGAHVERSGVGQVAPVRQPGPAEAQSFEACAQIARQAHYAVAMNSYQDGPFLVDGTWEAMWAHYDATTTVDPDRVVPDSLVLTVDTTAARQRVKTVRTKTGYRIVSHHPHGGTVVVDEVSVHQEPVSFFSTLAFRIFRDPQAETTTVHAVGFPVNNGVVAKRGNSIGHTWWAEVFGEYEATLVRDALRFVARECAAPAATADDAAPEPAEEGR